METLLIVSVSVIAGLLLIALIVTLVWLVVRAMGNRGVEARDVAKATGEAAKITTRALIRAGREVRSQGLKSTMRGSIQGMASWADAERPSLRPASAPDGTATLLFTDIEGSSAMNERLGDERWLEVLREHNRIVREQVNAHAGFEVKSQGDGFMIAFASARRALECAAGIQCAIAAYNEQHPAERIRVRVGLHTGETLRDKGDFYGKNVVLASRVADRAAGGEILVSSVVKQLTESSGDITFEDGFETELNGLSGAYELHRVVWEPQQEATSAPASPDAADESDG